MNLRLLQWVTTAVAAAPPIATSKHTPAPILAQPDPLLEDFGDDCDPLLSSIADVSLPQSYRQAMASKDAEHWNGAIGKDIDSLTENDTFEYVSSSVAQGRKVVETISSPM